MSDILAVQPKTTFRSGEPFTEVLIADRLAEVLSPKRRAMLTAKPEIAALGQRLQALCCVLIFAVGTTIKGALFALLVCAIGMAIWEVGFRSIAGLDLFTIMHWD